MTTLLTRHLVHILTPEWTPVGQRTRRLLILGSGPRALRLYNSIVGQPKPMYRFIGFMDSRSAQEMNEIVASLLIGNLEQLEEVLTSRVIADQILLQPDSAGDRNLRADWH